jgi:hypothetical protein
MRYAAATLVALFSVAVTGHLAAPSVHAATFSVNRIGDQADLNLADAACDVSSNAGSQCTLRAAIEEANDTPGPDTINFNITSASKTIAPATPLPRITDAVTINGYSQPNSSANTRAANNNAVLLIVLDGVNAGAAAIGLEVDGSDSIIRGLVIQRFGRAGVLLSGVGDHVVAGNFIGTDAAGSTSRGNTVGVEIESAGNTLGGTTPATRNLISGNFTDGVVVRDAIENLIVNNYIGTTRGGGASLANGASGIVTEDASLTRIGSGTAGGRNVVSGNALFGIDINDSGVGNNSVIAGNRIGTNPSGTADVGNGAHGIKLDASDITVGGDTAGERNVVSGNHGSGIFVSANRARVIGNFVGVNVTGTGALANDGNGVHVFGAVNATIGGSTAAERNVISGNGATGVLISGGNSNTIRGNRIGSRADGTGDLGNGGFGVSLVGSQFNTIGGSGTNDGNLIVGNGEHGVSLTGPATNNNLRRNGVSGNDGDGMRLARGPNTVEANAVVANAGAGIAVTAGAQGVEIVRNQILDNGELEIDLIGGTENGLGVTANDQDDPDTGANDLQNNPVLTSAVRASNGVTTLTGNLNSVPSSTFRLDVYLVTSPDPSNRGGATALLGTQVFSTNAGGDRTFAIALGGLSVGQIVTATVTALSNDSTSEFAGNRTVSN